MKRSFVKVARMRVEDVGVGDVVNREPDAETGWFEVAETKQLFNGDIQLADQTALLTISGPFFTLVGVQFVSEAEVPDQPPSPLPPVADDADEEGDAEQTAEANKSREADQTAEVKQAAATSFFDKANQTTTSDQAVPAHPTAPTDQSARKDEDYGDQSHADKGALPQLPSRQSQPVG